MFAFFTRPLRRASGRPCRAPFVRLDVELLESRLALSISAVPDTTPAPFNNVVEVEVVNNGLVYTASGVLLDSTHVLTAAHVLYDKGVLDSSVTVYPGRNGGNILPFGSVQGTHLAVHPSYISGPDAGTDTFDLGVITLAHGVSEATGAFTLLPLYPDDYFNNGGTIDILGYPAETYSGVNQYFSTGTTEGADATEIAWSLRQVPIQQGSSGSPVYVKSGNTRTIAGVVSEVSPTTGYATRITPDKYNWIISQLEGTPAAAAPGAQGPGAFDPTTGRWYLRSTNTPGTPDITPFAYGAPGWIGVTGDWTGDGSTTIGVVDPTTMTWYLKNSNTVGAPDITPFAYGAPGWIPVVGDWNGDGKTTIGVYDPATATWYLKNTNSQGAPDITAFQYGAPGWLPVVGDWNGDGKTSIGVVDPTTETWYLRNENSPGAPDIAPFQYGAPGWMPITGDWDGNHSTTIGVVDPATMLWYLRNSNTSGPTDYTPFFYGAPGWQPVAGNWNGHPIVPLPAAGRVELPIASRPVAATAVLQDQALPNAGQVLQAAFPGTTPTRAAAWGPEVEQHGERGADPALTEISKSDEKAAPYGDDYGELGDDLHPFRMA